MAALIRRAVDRDTANLAGAAGSHLYDVLPAGGGISADHADRISSAAEALKHCSVSIVSTSRRSCASSPNRYTVHRQSPHRTRVR
jgi:hypothetical protein